MIVILILLAHVINLGIKYIIQKNNGQLITSWYRKQTNTLMFNS